MNGALNLGQAFHEIVKIHGEKTALKYPQSGEEITYARLYKLVLKIAQHLNARGCKKGDVIGILMINLRNPLLA